MAGPAEQRADRECVPVPEGVVAGHAGQGHAGRLRRGWRGRSEKKAWTAVCTLVFGERRAKQGEQLTGSAAAGWSGDGGGLGLWAAGIVRAENWLLV